MKNMRRAVYQRKKEKGSEKGLFADNLEKIGQKKEN